MRILITGAGGQVGHELAAACARDETTAADHRMLDVTDRNAVLAAVTVTQPDVILHAGAWTAVDACESDPERAFAVNALGTRHVAEAARRVGAHLVYFSTDYVFDGAKDGPYHEWDPPNPQSVYGRSKLAGELEARAAPALTIVRLSWVCGDHGSNMVKTVLRVAAEHDELSFVDDQRGHPTFAESAAPLVRRLAGERRPGVFHVTNQGAVSWYEFAERPRRRRTGSRTGARDHDIRAGPAPPRAPPRQLRARQRRPPPRWPTAAAGLSGVPRGARRAPHAP